ncbi:coiled-coil domain-containing protein 89 [Clarias gariepinus]
MDEAQQALENLRGLSLEERTELGMLRSRIDEQSNLICMLKQRADELLHRCQALEQANTELRNMQVNMKMDLQNEQEKSEHLEQRFMDLAANHKEMIIFKDEYKEKNTELMLENEKLREENEKLFSPDLELKKETIHKLSQQLSDLTEEHRRSEKENQEKETSLLEKLQKSQIELKNAVDMHTEMVLKLSQIQEKVTMKETRFEALKKEKDELLELSTQREKVMQEQQEEIQELKKKMEEAENAKKEAEERFEKESAAVNTDLRVLQLEDAVKKAEQEFEAYKKYSSDLLSQEKELNEKLRHMVS